MRFCLRCRRQKKAVIPTTAASARHPTPAAIPPTAPPASPLLETGAGDAVVVDGGLVEETEREDGEVLVSDGVL